MHCRCGSRYDIFRNVDLIIYEGYIPTNIKLIIFLKTRPHLPEELNLRRHHCDNPKSCKVLVV